MWRHRKAHAAPRGRCSAERRGWCCRRPAAAPGAGTWRTRGKCGTRPFSTRRPRSRTAIPAARCTSPANSVASTKLHVDAYVAKHGNLQQGPKVPTCRLNWNVLLLFLICGVLNSRAEKGKQLPCFNVYTRNPFRVTKIETFEPFRHTCEKCKK